MHRPSVLDLTAELVAIDSQNPGTGEAGIADFVVAHATERGLSARVIETRPGRCNVIITADAGAGRHLGLSGHLDTKPVGDARHAWRTPPLQLSIEDDLAYGLGTSDMKGAVATMLCAADAWARTARHGRLSLILTADEEAGSEYGATALARDRLIDADAILIGEPSGIRTPWEALYVISRGLCCFELTIHSKQGHSGLSELLPTSATAAAADATRALAAFRPTVPAAPTVACAPTVNPAVRLSGGIGYGVHPGTATVATDIRLVPGMDHQTLDHELRVLLSSALPADTDWQIDYADQLGWVEAAQIAADHPLTAAAQRACTTVLGEELPLAAYPGGTDATPFINTAGVPSIAALGPGWLSVAHGPNECVGIRQLDQAAHLYEELAHHYLNPGHGPDAGGGEPQR